MTAEKKVPFAVPGDDDSPSKMDVGAFIASHVKSCDEDLDESSLSTSTSDSASDTSPSSRLSPPTPKTAALWRICTGLMAQEFSKGGVQGVDTTKPSNITAHGPGYIDGDGALDDVVVVGVVVVFPKKIFCDFHQIFFLKKEIKILANTSASDPYFSR